MQHVRQDVPACVLHLTSVCKIGFVREFKRYLCLISEDMIYVCSSLTERFGSMKLVGKNVLNMSCKIWVCILYKMNHKISEHLDKKSALILVREDYFWKKFVNPN